MDFAKFATEVMPKLTECQALVKQIAEREKRSNIVLIESVGLYEDALYGFQRLLRTIPKGGVLDLILESHGGSIDATSAIASLCRGRCTSLRVIAPFMAKSAATLLVLAADERVLTCSAQLGPVDPQVRHPEKRTMWFPAHSIKEAVEQAEAAKDPIVKAAMADKLDPFLIGAYKDAIAASTQYVEEAVKRWSLPNKEEAEIVSAFTDKYKSHGYPIDRKVLDTLNVPYTPADDELEELVCRLHEICYDILKMEGNEESLVMMTESRYIFNLGDFKTSGSFPGTTPQTGDQPAST
jgi:hypothetical protein